MMSRDPTPTPGLAHPPSWDIGVAMPLAFVTLYGSAFPVAKAGLAYSGTFEFLGIRYAIAAALLALVAVVVRSPWPRQPRQVAHIVVAGLLILGIFNASAFGSIVLGVPPAVCALITSMQPLLVALGAGPLLGEQVTRRQWGGLLLGIVGAVLVVSKGVSLQALVDPGVLLAFLALVSLSAGNLYQKKYCAQMNVFSGGVVQCLASAMVMLIITLAVGIQPIHWTWQFGAALAWMVVLVSVGAVSILYVMIRRGRVSQVASLFYLVPVSAAIGAYCLFQQVPTLVQLFGACLAALGVAIVVRPRKAPAAAAPPPAVLLGDTAKHTEW